MHDDILLTVDPTPRRWHLALRHALGALLFLLVFALAQTALAQTYTGQVIRVSDGDTLNIRYQGGILRVRLAEIDAPEIGHGRQKPGQTDGQPARAALAALVAGQTVRVEQTGTSYKRVVGRVYVGDRDINALLVQQGWAWVEPRYARDPRLYVWQRQARSAGRGIWANPYVVAPWQWRQTMWAKQP